MITQVSAPASQSAAYPTALGLRLTTYVEIRGAPVYGFKN